MNATNAVNIIYAKQSAKGLKTIESAKGDQFKKIM